MKVVEIRDAAGLEALRHEWNALLRESRSNSIFVTPEWVTAWWTAYGSPSELRVLAAYDEAGLLRGIAPLRAKQTTRYGQTVHALQFLGDAPVDSDSDYLDMVIAPGSAGPVMDAFLRHWSQDLRNGWVLLLNEIPETSPNLPAIRAAGSMVAAESEVACSVVRLPGTWDEYLGVLKPRFRTKVRSVLRNLEGRPEVKFRFCETVQDVERLLPILFDLHARRWQQEGKPGVFGDPRKREFYRAISPVLLERGWLRFCWLEWNGRVLACQYGFTYDGVYSQLQEGYEPASEHWNVGVGLRAWSIREYLKEGVREYDFLAGVGRHKSDWGSEVKQSKRILLARESHRNALFIHGGEWRGKLRTMIPEKVVAAQAARRQNGSTSHERLRQMAANCYVHSGAPALIRAVRNRYQLSVRPRPSWRRRSEGGARIFYYHRVNNDSDPFFTSTPADVFEAQMRYLAKHYRVVSLPEVSQHLGSRDSSETVVAVTFDDGYRDNYEFAYPILKQYNLPATIFLTTGSLDSNEPLWFEQMAEAVKKTEREFIDLELDIPRRFWLRNQEERLKSDKCLFGILRRLSDGDRHAWLVEILRQLGGGQECERRGKMLTWDQVRLMSTNGIDFGGHTVSHPFLSKLTPGQAVWEVSECKRRIEVEVQKAVNFFAYPNGREEDFADSNKEILRSAGYQGAVTTIWGMNYGSTDRMELRRGGPWEEDPALFAMKLDWYQLVNE
jgi:peptidoglycan/xylan/chitin deacetylase (PgdA/CDA1 family)/CelD/BcsL family acetyltransferase involved in cellulose biosynthesis